MTITTGHHDDSPTTNAVHRARPRVIARHVPLPKRFDSRRRRLPPMTRSDRTAEPDDGEDERTDVEHLLGEEHQRRAAECRSQVHQTEDDRHRAQQLVRHSHRKPSLSSVFQGACRGRRAVRRGSCRGSTQTSAAATKNDAGIDEERQRERAAISNSEPSGGPMNVLAIASALHIRPFAFSSWRARRWSA